MLVIALALSRAQIVADAKKQIQAIESHQKILLCALTIMTMV
jgi:hypothetical protein